MSPELNYRKGKGAFEVAISKHDLAVYGYAQIYERRSQGGFREDPLIKHPNKRVLTNNLIQLDQAWGVQVNWKVVGPLACLLDCGYWKASLIFEQQGIKETDVSPYKVVQDLGKDGYEYTVDVELKKGALKPGIYAVTCCLEYYLRNRKLGPIIGFHSLGKVKIFDEKSLDPSYPTLGDNRDSLPEDVIVENNL